VSVHESRGTSKGEQREKTREKKKTDEKLSKKNSFRCPKKYNKIALTFFSGFPKKKL
jgi:hypothetical protein